MILQFECLDEIDHGTSSKKERLKNHDEKSLINISECTACPKNLETAALATKLTLLTVAFL